jgi:hypothetical protein
MKLLAKAVRMYCEHGLATLARESASYLAWLTRYRIPVSLRHAYLTHLRPVLPTTGHPLWNGVLVAQPRKLLDPVVPRGWIAGLPPDLPLYESALVPLLRWHVWEDDRVVVVGGGYGVTVVTAARAVGRGGSVVCFEAVGERVRDIREALRLNRIAAPVTVHHAVVGHAVALYGDGANARLVSPAELPACDVLEIDCEGAETEILAGLRIRPRVIVVESHGMYGAPSAEVMRLLEAIGYRVEDIGPAEASMERFCIENDVRVLVAIATGTAAAGEPRPANAPSTR